MSEREATDGPLCSRPDPANRSHKNISRNKDRYNGHSRKSRYEAPPISSTPTRHYGSGPQVSQGARERGRGRSWDKSQQVWERGSEGEKRGKKASLNHLLNFTLSPRETQGTRGDGARRRGRRLKTPSYNKEQFMQANCQFVVADRGDYAIHTSDPDLLVNWDTIELVHLFCHEIPSCPICLYPPTAAKITRCGHVYCWSCVLHYLSLGERGWRKCPICYESIYKKDLKSVRALSAPQYSAGEVISMRLMVRERHSTLVRPSSHGGHAPPTLPQLSIEGGRFVKLLTCSVRQTLELIVGPEREALVAQLTSLGAEEQSEHCFIEQALEEIKTREQALIKSEEENNPVPDEVEKSASELVPQQCMTLSERFVEGDSGPAFSDSEDSSSNTSGDNLPSVPLGTSMGQIPSPPDAGNVPPPSTTSPPDSSLVYFYQSDDGQHIYLHTVNARCLVKEYGGLEAAPELIEARIVEMEQLTMTEEVRSRYKYLSHLPVTCQFALCELDLRPPVVSSPTLAFYRAELERRRNRRAKKKREEKMKDKMAVSTQPSPPSTAGDGFPLPSLSNQPLSPERIHDLLPQLTSSPPHNHHSHQTPEEPTESDSSGHPSFADALRGNPPPVWPIKTPSHPTSSTARAGSPEEGEGDGERVPTFQEAFTDALLTAHISTQPGESPKKTAKKGRKKLVLFSTGGARGSHN